MMQVVILAGGAGTRMGGQTKALLDVRGKPMLLRLLEIYSGWGMTPLILASDYAVPSDARVVRDGNVRRGTGGAVLNALPHLVDPCCIVNGDSLVPGLDMRAVRAAYIGESPDTRKAGLMVVCPAQEGGEPANTQVLGGMVASYSKEHRSKVMHHVDAGIFVTSPHAFSQYAEGAEAPFDLGLVYRNMIRANQLVAFETTIQPYEVGSKDGLERYRAYVKGGGV